MRVFYHKDAIQVPEPAVLTNPEIAKEAAGPKLVYQDTKTDNTEKPTFLSAGDSVIKVLSHDRETAVSPKQLNNAQPQMSVGNANPCVLIGSIFLAVFIGGLAGWAIGRVIYKELVQERSGGCAGTLFRPLQIAIAFFIALIIGIAVGILVFILSLFLGIKLIL
ncbi:MAG: hypothetical protein ABIM46_05445 [candidate division WOR-3 bacterium]